MNQLAHIFITYVMLSFVIPNTREYFLPIALFAIVLDFDHVPGYFKMLFMSKSKRKKLKMNDFVRIFRLSIQEPIGIITIELVLGLLYVFGVKSMILLIAMLAIFLHWFIDFLTVHTRPFVPFNNKIVCLFFKTKKQRTKSELIITLISFILFLLVFL